MNKYKKGFTILELLVVIAIIGILAAVILGAVGKSRDKAADKAIIENLLSVRSEAGIYFSNTSTYGTYGAAAFAIYGTTSNTKCPASTYIPSGATYADSTFRDNSDAPSGIKFTHSNVVVSALTEANLRSGGSVTTTGIGGTGPNRLTNARCIAMGSEWVAMVQLKENSTKAWCVDSNGASNQVTSGTGLATGFNMTATTARCATS